MHFQEPVGGYLYSMSLGWVLLNVFQVTITRTGYTMQNTHTETSATAFDTQQIAICNIEINKGI